MVEGAGTAPGTARAARRPRASAPPRDRGSGRDRRGGGGHARPARRAPVPLPSVPVRCSRPTTTGTRPCRGCRVTRRRTRGPRASARRGGCMPTSGRACGTAARSASRTRRSAPASRGSRSAFDYDDESDPGPYPIPSDAPIEGGAGADGDRHVLVVDTAELHALRAVRRATRPAARGRPAPARSTTCARTRCGRPAGPRPTPPACRSCPASCATTRWPRAHRPRHPVHRATHAATRTSGRRATGRLVDRPGAPADGSVVPAPARRRRRPVHRRAAQVIAQAMKTHGIILADNGSPWYVSGAPDERWDNDVLHQLDVLHGRGLRGGGHLLVDRSTPTPGRRGSAPVSLAPTRPWGRGHRGWSSVSSGVRRVDVGLRGRHDRAAVPRGSDRHGRRQRACSSRSRAGRLTACSPTAASRWSPSAAAGPTAPPSGPTARSTSRNNGGVLRVHRPRRGLILPGPVAGTRGRAMARSSGSTSRPARSTTLYTECDGHPLRAPNDLVFDAHGGFWFTDHGARLERSSDRTGVYYAPPDGSSITEVLFPLDAPNGVGLSPGGRPPVRGRDPHRAGLAVGRDRPGRASTLGMPLDAGGDLLHGAPGTAPVRLARRRRRRAGCASPRSATGGITVDLARRRIASSSTPIDDPLVTNICFGGDDLRTAYVTSSGTGGCCRCRGPGPRPAPRVPNAEASRRLGRPA